jgi:hypothetical protein
VGVRALGTDPAQAEGERHMIAVAFIVGFVTGVAASILLGLYLEQR